jgi:spermidine/putrescine transport system substrate-binding protein
MRSSRLLLSLFYIAIAGILSACQSNQGKDPQKDAPSIQITIYGWADYMPQSVLKEFEKEHGVRVVFEVYGTQEEAIQNIRNDQVYDVVVMGNELIPEMVSDNLLAPIEYENVLNFRNISANFRDMTYDPDNAYSVPYHWGTTGLLVRTDLVEKPVTRWADLWDPAHEGKVAVWAIPGTMLGIALKSLGYSANSEDPVELWHTLEHLKKLKNNVLFLDLDLASSVSFLENGEAVVAVGWAYDMLTVSEEMKSLISYILPEEGTLLWGDNLVIPANSPNKATAELFINFVLEPKISAQIINEGGYPVPNDAATPFIDPMIANDPVSFPSMEELQNAEVFVPLSLEATRLREEIWNEFMMDAEGEQNG